MNYCYGCMEQMEPEQVVCPRCGYDNSYRHNEEGFLPEETILAGKYLVGRKLGKGGFGITYLGIDLSLNVKVAIKEYFPGNISTRSGNSKSVRVSNDQETTQKYLNGRNAFQKEAQTLAMFNSPSIAHVREYFLENNTAYIVMDYVGGIGLDDAIKQSGGRLPWQRVVTLMKELMPELDRLHKKNLVHRDIKPANLKIVTDEDTGKERLALLDFGAARSFASADATGTYTSILTHGYAPLEQYKTKSHQGPYTDVYALCATMYKAISGEIPPSALDMVDGEVKLAPFSDYGVNVPADVEKAIFHGMALKSEKRPQTMKELYDEFAAIDVSDITEETPTSPDNVKADEPPVQVSDEIINEEPRENDDPQSAQKNPEDEKELSYQEAKRFLDKGTMRSCRDAAILFKRVAGYKDADALLKDCDRKIFELESDIHYTTAKSMMSSGTTNSYKAALDELNKIPIPGWKDLDELVKECEKKIHESSGSSPAPEPAEKNEIPEWKKVQQISSQYKQENDEYEDKKKKSVKPVVIILVIIVFAAAVLFLIKPFGSNKQNRSTSYSYSQKTYTPVSSTTRITGKNWINNNPLYDNAYRNEQIGSLEAGEIVELTGDVVNKMVPVHVLDSGENGWILYSSIDIDNLQPPKAPVATITQTPTPNAKPTITPTQKIKPTITPTVSQGSKAKVIKDNLFRKNPSNEAEVIYTLKTGVTVTLTGQSRTVDYKEWVQIQDSEGIIGWIPENSLEISK